ncbi:uncharacterized protein METZ01_LOCUS302086, partial [marine metagenome]
LHRHGHDQRAERQVKGRRTGQHPDGRIRPHRRHRGGRAVPRQPRRAVRHGPSVDGRWRDGDV